MKFATKLTTILLVLIFSTIGWCQLTGTKTIDPAGSGGNNYLSFTAAISALNTNGVGAGGVTFNVASGTYSVATTTETFPLSITAQGTSSDQIIFQKATGTVTLSTSTGASVVILSGADYVTFDGIDIVTTSTTPKTGFSVVNASATNGAQHNTIRNCSITLNRSAATTRAVYQNVSFAPTSAAGTNSYNTYQNITIHNCQVAIRLLGNSTNNDVNNVIANNSVGVGTTDDIMNSGSGPAGAYCSDQNGLSIHDNVFANITNTSAAASGTIGNGDAFGMRAYDLNGTNYIYNNTIYNIKHNGGATDSRSAIGIQGHVKAAGTLKIYNNMIYGFTHSRTTEALSINPTTENNIGYGLVGICIGATGSATIGSGSQEVYHNSINFGASTTNYVSSTALYVASGTNTIKNNLFANSTPAQTTAKHYTVYLYAGTNTIDHNNLYIANGNGFVGYSSGDVTDSTAWRATVYGANSKFTDPLFISATNLHIQANSFSPVSDAGTNLLTTVATDIDGDSRTTTPDIGADEGNFGLNNPAPGQNAWTPSIPPDPAINNTPPLTVTFTTQAGANTNPASLSYSHTTTRPAGLTALISPIANTINRYWTLSTPTENFTGAILELRFTAADLPAGIPNPLTATPPLMAAYSTDGGTSWLTTTGTVSGPVSGVYSFTVSGLNHLSIWALGNSGALPVELSAFRANQVKNGIDLVWRTESEINTHYFLLERWADGDPAHVREYRVNSRSVNGHSSTPIDYVVHDTYQLLVGRIYTYRLSEVTLDGHTTALRTISVTMRERSAALPYGVNLLDAYPNPFNPTTTIRVQLSKAGQATIDVYDLSGHLVKQLYKGYVGSMAQTIGFDGSSLASGMYIVQIRSGKYSAQTKLLLLK